MDSFLAAIDGISLEEKEQNVANGYDQTESKALAPIEMMSEFLLLVSSRRIEEAYRLCQEILEHEPDNKMLIEYKLALKEVLTQEAEAKDDSSEEDEQKDGDYEVSDSDSNSSKSTVDSSEENKENEDSKENSREDEAKLQEYIRTRK